MSYDINLHISETSDEGRAIASLAAKLRVTRDEAAKRLLKQAARQTAKPAGKRAHGTSAVRTRRSRYR